MGASHKSKRVELRVAGENQSIFNSNNYSPPLPAPALLPHALPSQPSPAVPSAPTAHHPTAVSSSFTTLTATSTIVAAPTTTSQTQNQEFRDKSEPKEAKSAENSSTGSPKKDDKTTVLHIQLNGLVSGSKSAIARLLVEYLEEFQAQNSGSDGSGTTEMEQEVLEVVVAVKRRKDLAFAVHDGKRAGQGENELDSQGLATGSILTIDERLKVVVTHDTNNDMPHNSNSRNKTQSASSYPQLDGEVGLLSYQYHQRDAQKGLDQLISRVLSSDSNDKDNNKEPVNSVTETFSLREAEVASQVEATSEVISEIVQLEQQLAAMGVSGDLEATKQVIQDWIRSLQAESGNGSSSDLSRSDLNQPQSETEAVLAERKRRPAKYIEADEAHAKQWVYHLNRLFEPLSGEMIRIGQAAEDYDMIRVAINEWARSGYLQPIEKEMNRFLVNRKSIAIASAIHRKFGGHGKRMVRIAMRFYEGMKLG